MSEIDPMSLRFTAGQPAINEQRVTALLAALLAHEDITPNMLEQAISRACDLKVGEPCSRLANGAYPIPLVRAFTAEQARRLGARPCRVG